MTAVARMALLDLHTLAPYRRQFLAMLLLVPILTTQPALALPLLSMVATVAASFPFSVAERENLQTLHAVLPLHRRTVLAGHYAWALAAFVVAAVIGTALALALAQHRGDPLTGTELMLLLAVSWTNFAVLVSVQLPMFVRFGYERVRLVAILPIAGLGGLASWILPRIHPIDVPAPGWLALAVVGGAVALLASYRVATAVDPGRVR